MTTYNLCRVHPGPNDLKPDPGSLLDPLVVFRGLE